MTTSPEHPRGRAHRPDALSELRDVRAPIEQEQDDIEGLDTARSSDPAAASTPTQTVTIIVDPRDPETEPDESTEWGADHREVDRSSVAAWVAASEYASGPGLPPRGLAIACGGAAAACATLDLTLTSHVGFFFDLCFVVICLVMAMAASPRALFSVAVMPPLIFGAVVLVVAAVAPASITGGSFSHVVLTGLAAHAVPLCAAYGVALLVACGRGLAQRAGRPPG